MWPLDRLTGVGRPAAHNLASLPAMLAGCNAIAYARVFGEPPRAAAAPAADDVPIATEFRDVSAVICANCHSTINHIAPLF